MITSTYTQEQQAHIALVTPHLQTIEKTAHTPEITEKLTYISPVLPSLQINSEITLENVILSLAPERLFIQTGNSNLMYIHYWNCSSIGTTKSGIMLLIQDVVMNEKIDMQPEL